jgi:class 3 adenylate cyclase
VIKFSGDALTVVWFVQDREAPSLSEATLMAARCTDALHTAIEEMEGNPGLSLHIGLGAGRLTCVEVGGAYKRMEFVLAGAPMGQISIAEPLAVGWETVISPEAFNLVNEGDIDATLVSELPQEYYDTMLCKYDTPELQAEERRARFEEHRADYARGCVVPPPHTHPPTRPPHTRACDLSLHVLFCACLVC